MERTNPILPKQAENHLKKNLGSDFDDFMEALGKSPKRAIRVNTLKADPQEIAKVLSLTEKTAYCDCGYIADSLNGDHPYHRAGLFYMQEPSAMLPVEAARPYLDDIFAKESFPLVLDLCAAPGGKTGQIAAIMNGRGAIMANETVFKRAGSLASNVERLGVRNAIVTSHSPDKISKLLGGAFDVVIVDAPCSGEGMLRKESGAADNMNEKTMLACALRQREIMNSAAECVKENGLLIYSTCTLNATENEEVLRSFTESKEFVPLECPHLVKVRKSNIFPAYRAFPQDGGGEGHFVCVMRKTAPARKPPKFVCPFDGLYKKTAELKALLSPLSREPIFDTAYRFKDSVILSPPLPFVKGLSVVKAGVKAATTASRLIPDHAYVAALARKDAVAAANVCFETGSEEQRSFGKAVTEKYLRGEEPNVETTRDGYGVFCVDDYPLGLIKSSLAGVKNHYPKGLRKQ